MDSVEDASQAALREIVDEYSGNIPNLSLTQ